MKRMWVAKFKIQHDCWITGKTLTLDFISTGIPLNTFEKNGQKYHTGFNYLKGKRENKEKFIKSLAKDSRVVSYERKGDHLFTLIKGEEFVSHAHCESLFFVSPVHKVKGYEYWELGSWNRNDLIDFLDRSKKFCKIEMLRIKEEIPSLVLYQSAPTLTLKQKEIFEMAQELGYYQYPRKISVAGLAKKLRYPRTTVQEHLRRAENKILNMQGLTSQSYDGTKSK